MVTWAVRRHRLLLLAIAVLNLGLVAGTVMLAMHYAVDVLATVAMWGGSLAAYRLWAAGRTRNLSVGHRIRAVA